jgi:hypothetical protein
LSNTWRILRRLCRRPGNPILRGEGSRGWRANFDWFVANHVNVYAVLEGKYDSAFAKATADKSAGLSAVSVAKAEVLAKAERTSRGYPIYVTRQ